MFIFVDLETTSKRPSSAEILTADFIHADKSFDIIEKKSFKFRPRIWDKDASDATSIHGITRDQAFNFLPYGEVAPEMFEWLLSFKDSHLVSHANRMFNSTYDQAILRFHALDNGVYFDFGRSFPESKYISTHSLAKFLNVGCELNLKALCNYFNLGSFEHHNSQEDVLMCYKLFLKLMPTINLSDFFEWEHYKKRDDVKPTKKKR
jgi:DNA polymerase III epsilon subunit-like protein